MSLFLLTLRALAPLFLLILLGYGLKRARILHTAHVPVLNGVVVNLTLPALVVLGLARAPRLPLSEALLPLALLLAQIITLAAAFALGRGLRLPGPTLGATLIVGAFGNTGFLGYPMTLALLPVRFPDAILLDQFGMTILLYLSAAVIGARLGSGQAGAAGLPGQERAAILKFLRSPLFLSLVVGSLARVIPWPHALLSLPAVQWVGSVMAQCLTYLGQGTTPVVLLALGVALRPGAARLHLRPLLLSSALKLLLCPLAMWALCLAFGLSGDRLRVGVLLAAMPTAVVASVLCGQHELEGDYAVGAVFASTVFSALSVPLLLSILR